jgi:hypothetical protein
MAVLPLWIKTGLSSAAFQPSASGLGLVKHEKLLSQVLETGLPQWPWIASSLLPAFLDKEVYYKSRKFLKTVLHSNGLQPLELVEMKFY